MNSERFKEAANLESDRRLFVCVLIIFCLLATAHGQTGKRIVGYYYGKGRPDYELSSVPFEKLSHLIYSLALPTVHGDCELSHPDVDVPNLQSLRALRKQNPRLLVLLSVGGWSGSRYFSDIAATSLGRRRFSTSCLKLVRENGLDGIDIDWEYPVTGGKKTDHKRKSDKENFVLLLRQLRTDMNALHVERALLLTIASTCYRNHLNDLSVQKMAEVLDWFNLMGYDFNEMQPKLSSHHSSLFAWPTVATVRADAMKFANDDAAVNWYLDNGVPASKIVLGLPFYGQVWANVPDANHGLFEPFGGRPGEDGTLSYREIVDTYLPAYTRYWDDQAKVPWLYNARTKTAISYEDPESIAAKARYVIEKELGGIMFWDLGQDDSKSTLLEAVHQALTRD